MHAMIDFYVASAVASRRIMSTTAPQIKEKLERVFGTLENDYNVKMEDEKIIGLDSKTLQTWFIHASEGWKPGTINAYVNVINPFLRWAHKMSNRGVLYLEDDLSGILCNVRIPSIEELPEEERPKDKYYTPEQVKELLYGNHGRNQVRDRAIMALVLYSGLRVSELCSLTVGQFRESPHGKLKLKRKGGAWATAVVGEEAYPLIEAYLKTRNDIDDPSAPLFMTTHGKPCTREQLYKCISYKQKEMGIATGPHALRHTAISEVSNNFGAAMARDFANHKSMHVTNRYAHTTEDQRVAAVNGLHWGCL